MKLFLLGTAREGSTRLKKKMVRPFDDTSLHEIQLKKFEELVGDDLFSGVGMALNKNDKILWDMTEKTNVPIIERSDESVTGLRPRSQELHFLEDIDADYIMWVNGCLPFLTAETLREAAREFIRNQPNFKSMTSVIVKYNWYWNSETKKGVNYTDPKICSTQKCPPLLETAHAFHIFNRKYLLENDSYFKLEKDDPHLYVMKDEVECLDIDHKLDFDVCEALWKVKKNKDLNIERKDIEINGKKISEKGPFFFIAEIGINHNGSMENVKKLIDMAVMSGADAIKFQKRTPDICVPEHQKNVPRQTPWGLMTYLDYKKRVEFNEEDYKEIDKYCKEKNIIWFASPWDLESFDFLEKFDIPAYKIASAKLTDRELLMRIKKTKKPVFMSIGGSTMEQARKAVSLLEDSNPLVILHCNSSYPANDDELNLSIISELKKEFPSHIIGYSGHELGIDPSCTAAALGAKVIERHITLDRNMWGTDHSVSLEAGDTKKLIEKLKRINSCFGDGIKKICKNEKVAIEKLRDIDTL